MQILPQKPPPEAPAGVLVGLARFELTDAGVKVPCLTTWRQPIDKKDRTFGTVLVGCLEGFEPSASRATIWRANQLRHRHHIMRPKGLEPPAHCLEGSCSIRLSYGRIRFLPTRGTLQEVYYHIRGILSIWFGKFSTAAPGAANRKNGYCAASVPYTPAGAALFTKYSSYHKIKE